MIFDLDDTGHFIATVEPAADNVNIQKVLLVEQYVDTQTLSEETIIHDFDPQYDTLDLSDVLVNEEQNSLDDYLSFAFEDGNTIITIDSNGMEESGDVFTITLDGTDLSAIYEDDLSESNYQDFITTDSVSLETAVADSNILDAYSNNDWMSNNHTP